MNVRLKKIREHLKMTQLQFSESIGISRSNLTNIENGKIQLSDRNIKTICSIYNISEDWLKNGNGEMFNKLSEDEEFEILVKRLYADNDPFKKEVIKTMLSLDDEEWKCLEKLLVKFKK